MSLRSLIATLCLAAATTTLAAAEPFAATADSTAVAWLRVEGRTFFQNNEYFGQRTAGYTLPGFALQPRVVWQVEPRVRLELGAHWLHLWGARGYPMAGSYGVWPVYTDTLRRAHILPWVQASVRLAPWASITVGSFIDSNGHHLPRPMYDPERLMVADPETGLMLQLAGRYADAQVWVDWQEYIWQHSPTQERFNMGAVARAWLPAAGGFVARATAGFVGQHQGGQALQQHIRLQNHFNLLGSVGAEYTFSPWIAAGVQCYAMLFAQSGDTLLSFASGRGIYPEVWCTVASRLRIDAAYWQATGFVPLLGSALYATVPAAGGTSLHTQLLALGINYTTRSYAHCTVVADARLYHYLGTDADPTQYAFGVQVRFNPTVKLL